MALSVNAVIAIGSAIVTYVVHATYGLAYWWSIPIYGAIFIVYHGYRMLIYERFISPLSRLPGPKVVISISMLIIGTLVVWRISKYFERRTWSSTLKMAS